MFRLSEFMREIRSPTPLAARREPPGPVVIWNLIRRCNLRCRHCYSISGDVDFPGELTTAEVFRVMDELRACRVPALILSGGEPLLRPDIFRISERAKAMGFYTGLSTNGALISRDNIGSMAAVGYDYIGVSLDGIGATHDRFRGMPGSFRAALDGIRLCRDRGLKVGLRFTMTMDNQAELEDVLDLAEAERVHKFYLSHLVYAGRGNKNRASDAALGITRDSMTRLFDRAWSHAARDRAMEFVTGNNDADGVFLYLWARQRFPDRAEHLRAKLAQWGGNASGVNIANIDNLGNVHPDTFWWGCSIGNVRRRAFADIWSDLSNPLMAGLRSRPRPVKGRCGACRFLDVCGGNTRVRAWQLTGDAWAEDPACYLTDAEIGVAPGRRLAVTPFRGARHEARSRSSA
jgi:heme d1 biosynthesis radical SAM protein NirJ